MITWIICLAVAAACAAYLLFFRGLFRGKHAFVTTTRLSIMDKEVQRACRYIEANFGDPELTPAVVADSLTTGEAFLQALFMRELGMTVEEFITQVRVNHGKLLLGQRPSTPADMLALSIGFSSEEEFRSAFKKITSAEFADFAVNATQNGGKDPSS
jgi:transcriptional regulator GlxA family with amidase domain